MPVSYHKVIVSLLHHLFISHSHPSWYAKGICPNEC
jgi:hypothetical protein